MLVNSRSGNFVMLCYSTEEILITNIVTVDLYQSGVYYLIVESEIDEPPYKFFTLRVFFDMTLPRPPPVTDHEVACDEVLPKLSYQAKH